MSKSKMNKPEPPPGSPVWMTSWADLVSLLLTFFILLFTFSSINEQKFQEVMSAIQHSMMGRTGILSGSINVGDGEARRLDEFEIEAESVLQFLGENELTLLEMVAELEDTYSDVKSFLQDVGLEDDVQLRLEERGIVLELPAHILFDSGMAVIKRDFLETIDLLANLLGALPNQIIIEGHTDNVPISTFQFPSNWELSVTRAVSVARYLVEIRGLSPYQVVATGYGEYHPLDTNETPEGRSRNRRVSIVISIIRY